MRFYSTLLFIVFALTSFGQNSKLFKELSKANKAYENGEWLKAKNSYLNVLKYDSLYVKAYIQLANIDIEEKHYKDALVKLNTSLQIEKKQDNDQIQLAYIYSLRSFCFFNLDNTKESLNDISTAIKLNSENPNYFFIRSLLRRMNGDINGCCQDLKMSAQLGNIKANDYIAIYCVK